MTGRKPRITILGIGNPLCRDDGIGIRVIQEIQVANKLTGVDIIDGGASPDLLSLVDANIDKLIIIDALRGGSKAGTIYRLKIEEANISDEGPLSLHGLGLMDGLKMMKKLNIEPSHMIIIGIEPLDTSYGLNLSAEIESIIPEIIAAVEQELS
jgi:hydrogenase maturation protease